MFLVQLGALALWKSDHSTPQDDSEFWLDALRFLTQDFSQDEPWVLTNNNWKKPAFLQPPDPDCNQWENNFTPKPKGWSKVNTPDEIDMIVTSKNHDLKRAVAFVNRPEDWIFALVTLQTGEGYGGSKNYGIVRMNGAYSSRPLLGLVPTESNSISVNSSLWWQRDMHQLLSWRQESKIIDENNTHALLWCLPWKENEQLDFRRLDPWFIEVCRRIRLVEIDGRIIGFQGSSKKSRIDSKDLKGYTGDPWAPVQKKEGKNFTLGGKDFDYGTIVKLLFSGEWKVPYLATRGKNENGDMILIAEAFSRGNKTEGFKSRLVPIPKETIPFLSPETSMAEIAEEQMKEIKIFSVILRNSLLYMAAGGNKNVFWNKDEKNKLRTKYKKFLALPCKHFEFTVDRHFFNYLWLRHKGKLVSEKEESKVRLDFLKKLQKSVQKEFEGALPTIPCQTILKTRATTRARGYFNWELWRNYPELFAKENPSE